MISVALIVNNEKITDAEFKRVDQVEAAVRGYDTKEQELHDLSINTTGKPAIVQIHDTSIPDCSSLKSRSLQVIENQSYIIQNR